MGVNLHSQQQSAFTLDLKQDIIISTLALGLFLGAHFIDDQPVPIGNLDKNDVNAFDRRLMFHYPRLNIIKHSLWPVLAVAPIITPLAVAGLDIRNNWGIWLTYGVMYAQATFLAYGTRMFIGKTVNRNRPFDYFADDIGQYVTRNSFPSGSTTIVFMPATFLSVTFSAEFPDSRWRIPVIVGSYTLATAVGTARILTGHHFLTDVLAGAAIGSFFGWLIPTLHRRNNDDNNVSFHFIGNGAVVALRF